MADQEDGVILEKDGKTRFAPHGHNQSNVENWAESFANDGYKATAVWCGKKTKTFHPK